MLRRRLRGGRSRRAAADRARASLIPPTAGGCSAGGQTCAMTRWRPCTRQRSRGCRRCGRLRALGAMRWPSSGKLWPVRLGHTRRPVRTTTRAAPALCSLVDAPTRSGVAAPPLSRPTLNLSRRQHEVTRSRSKKEVKAGPKNSSGTSRPRSSASSSRPRLRGVKRTSWSSGTST